VRLCKAHHDGIPGGTPTAWVNPLVSPTDCISTDGITGEQTIVLDGNRAADDQGWLKRQRDGRHIGHRSIVSRT